MFFFFFNTGWIATFSEEVVYFALCLYTLSFNLRTCFIIHAGFYRRVIFKQEYFTSIQKISIVHENHTAVLIHKIMNYDYFYNLMPHLRLHTFTQRLSVHCKEIIFVHRTYIIMFSLSSYSLHSISSVHVHSMRNSIDI